MQHVLALVWPLLTLSFWLTGPHPWRESLLCTLPMIALYWIDGRPVSGLLPARPHAWQLYALSFLQLANHALLLVTVSMLRVDSPSSIVQAFAMVLPTIALGGINAGCSGVATAHALVHRSPTFDRALGRILFVCALDPRPALPGRQLTEVALLALIAYCFGTLALGFFLIQTAATMRLRQTVLAPARARAQATAAWS